MRTKNFLSNVLKKLAPIALASTMLVACGKNNKVGGPGGPGGNPGIFQGVNGMYSPGQIGVQNIDSIIASTPCTGSQQYPQQGGGRQGTTFICNTANPSYPQMKTCTKGSVGAYASGNVRVGRTYSGHIAIYKDVNQNQGELTVLYCVDAMYTPQAISQLNYIGLVIKNQYVTKPGTFSDLIADTCYTNDCQSKDVFYQFVH